MCFGIVEVALLVCAGPNSVAGPFTADRFDGTSAAGGGRRQQASHHKRPRSFPRGTPKLGSAPVRRPLSHCIVHHFYGPSLTLL